MVWVVHDDDDDDEEEELFRDFFYPFTWCIASNFI
jgi:hypothetical protein